jgi:hypothetical protein
MSVDLVTSENVSLELIHSIYESAMMEVSIDDEKQFVRIKEEILARARLPENKERIQLGALYGIKEDAQRVDRLELCNRINDQFVMIRASITEAGDLYFDYDITIKGGVTKKQIAQATRMFLKFVPKAVSECDEDGIID